MLVWFWKQIWIVPPSKRSTCNAR